MIVRPQDLELGPRKWAGSVAAPDRHPGDGIELRGPIAFGLEASAEDGRIEVNGWLHAIPRVTCARCIEATPFIVRREYRLFFEPDPGDAVADETELDDIDLDTDYYPSDGLDLRPILAEQVLLDLPMKPLCDEDCLGLCAQCGKNLNEEKCDCEVPVDPRLSALGALRDQL
jgi:uncharacterized protein